MQSIVIRGDRAYLPNIAASPTGPLRFNLDTHAFVSLVGGVTGATPSDLGTLNLHLGARDPEPGKRKISTLQASTRHLTTARRCYRRTAWLIRGCRIATSKSAVLTKAGQSLWHFAAARRDRADGDAVQLHLVARHQRAGVGEHRGHGGPRRAAQLGHRQPGHERENDKHDEGGDQPAAPAQVHGGRGHRGALPSASVQGWLTLAPGDHWALPRSPGIVSGGLLSSAVLPPTTSGCAKWPCES